jgi:hypothetical protein
MLALIFTACANTTATPDVTPSSATISVPLTQNELPISPQFNGGKNEMDEAIDVSDISGTYELEKGVDNYKTITKANMIIEKLDHQNFGYYYAVQDEKATPNAFFGIFRLKNGTYYSKVIESETTTSLNSNIKLIIEDERLKLTVLTSYGRRIIVWSKVVDKTLIQDKELDEAMLDAKNSYTQIYKNKFHNLTEI